MQNKIVNSSEDITHLTFNRAFWIYGTCRSIFEAAKRKADEEIDEQVRQERLSSLRRAQQISRDLMKEETILSESGMQCIVRDAFEDG